MALSVTANSLVKNLGGSLYPKVNEKAVTFENPVSITDSIKNKTKNATHKKIRKIERKIENRKIECEKTNENATVLGGGIELTGGVNQN